ncbi:MAG: RNA polymerase sigma-54 factor [Azospirillum brasilense]|nr:MAG: RNA polymerase sigma-54 factor [Azospirillum brasilense]
MVGLKQELRQTQQLAMTQQLQQSIKLLQLSAAELQEYIDTELEKNPLLSREEGEVESAPEPDAEAEAAAARQEESDTAGVERGELEISDSDYSAGEALTDESYQNDWADDADRVSAGATYGGSGAFEAEDGEGFGIEATAARDKTLREHLFEQIHMDITDPMEIIIAEKLTDLLDDAGYLREDTATLASQLGVGKDEINGVIAKLQRMEPVGVFARSLKECLALQLADMDRLDPVMQLFLEHMDMMAQGDLAGLRRKCGVDEEDFTQMLADIRRCNPKPGSGFAVEDSYAVVPDVLVRQGKQGGWVVELNPDALPRVLVNRRYVAEVQATSPDKETKKFLNEQLANASWLLKALDQRAQTILKVAQEIVKQQEKFLLHGIRFLKPLVLKDIALAIGMHESTVSRVTTAKFIATPRGTLELKYFFTSSINAAGGASDFSSKTVQYYIKEIIAGESPKKILSDDAIVQLLKDRNIDVARRTVTKYREEMDIPSSVVRRRQKAGI